MKSKLTSRKFWISVAAFLGSISASVAGIVTEEKWITIVGVICGMLSAAFYAAAEAYVDASGTAAQIHAGAYDDDAEA